MALVFLERPLLLAIPAALVIFSIVMICLRRRKNTQLRKTLEERYGTADTDLWTKKAWEHAEAIAEYSKVLGAYRTAQNDISMRKEELTRIRLELGRGESPEKALYLWNQAIRCWEEYHSALRDQAKLENHLQDLQSMARSADAPDYEDTLTCNEAQTLTMLNDAASEQQRLQNRLGQYQGRMSNLGSRAELQKQLDQKKKRIAKLEDNYAALTIAMETLAEARAELQRRFAPRITKRAQKMLAAMTDGRYTSVTMSDDFSLRTSAGEEETLRDAIWRSDGTMDQLYLALRLAVAEELTPKAPLVLDDVLVRFDDKRMAAAVDLLKDMAEERQIILFSCQGREANI